MHLIFPLFFLATETLEVMLFSDLDMFDVVKVGELSGSFLTSFLFFF